MALLPLTHYPHSPNRLFDFGAEAKASVGIPADLIVPPFAVVASNKFDEVRLGVGVPVDFSPARVLTSIST